MATPLTSRGRRRSVAPVAIRFDVLRHGQAQPADSKGDLARALFYFYTRYAAHPPSRFSLSNFNGEEATLRRWHERDPPDAAERARNDAVYGVQGNRNPFIDDNTLADRIADF